MISIKSAKQIEQMRKSCEITKELFLELEKKIKPGVTTKELDTFAFNFYKKHGATPNFLNYNGYPATICASVNNEVIHGIPSAKRVLKDGDIISIDMGCIVDGWHSDAARTFTVGKVSDEAQRLIDVTRDSFFKGIEYAKVGNRLSDISHEIQSYVEAAGFSVVRDFVGHGIGRNVHEDPNVPNFGKSGRGPKLQEGMVLAIEPMVNAGTYKVTTLKDGWTVVTADNSLSAHYENTVAILSDGPEILTLIK